MLDITPGHHGPDDGPVAHQRNGEDGAGAAGDRCVGDDGPDSDSGVEHPPDDAAARWLRTSDPTVVSVTTVGSDEPSSTDTTAVSAPVSATVSSNRMRWMSGTATDDPNRRLASRRRATPESVAATAWIAVAPTRPWRHRAPPPQRRHPLRGRRRGRGMCRRPEARVVGQLPHPLPARPPRRRRTLPLRCSRSLSACSYTEAGIAMGVPDSIARTASGGRRRSAADIGAERDAAQQVQLVGGVLVGGLEPVDQVAAGVPLDLRSPVGGDVTQLRRRWLTERTELDECEHLGLDGDERVGRVRRRSMGRWTQSHPNGHDREHQRRSSRFDPMSPFSARGRYRIAGGRT